MTSVVGFKSFFAHRVWCCVVGAAAVTRVRHHRAGRWRVVGPGSIAAFLVAVYPNIWMSDELALSETLTPLLVALVLLCAYRFWKRPGMRRMLVLGAVTGMAMLGRDELSLLVPLVVIPLALVAQRAGGAPAWPWPACGTLAALTVVAPWVGYNMSRFEKPTFISSGLGITLASANCDMTWSGPFEGYWSMHCARSWPRSTTTPTGRCRPPRPSPTRCTTSAPTRTGLVPVELARLGRAFGAFHPLDQIGARRLRRDAPVPVGASSGSACTTRSCALALGGTLVLRRRRVPIFPLWALGVDVVATVLVSFGNTRYRTPFEVALVLLAAVQLDAIWERCGDRPPDRRRDGRAPGTYRAASTRSRVRRAGDRRRHVDGSTSAVPPGPGPTPAWPGRAAPPPEPVLEARGWDARPGRSWRWPTPPTGPGPRRRARGAAPGTARRSTADEHVDPGLVPQVDPVGDDSQRGHGLAPQHPPDDPALLRAEDRRHQQEEREQTVQQFLGQAAARRIVLEGDARHPEVRHGPQHAPGPATS